MSIKLSKYLQDIALNEIGETNEIIIQRINELRNLLIDQSIDKKLIDISDSNLVRFLRPRKLDVPKAFDTIVNYIKFKETHSLWFDNLSSKEFKRYSKLYKVQEKVDENGRLVCVFPAYNCIDIFTKEYLQENPLAIIRGHIWFVDRISRNVNAQICGIEAIIDFNNLSFWDHIYMAGIIKVQEQISLVRYLQDCIGLRLKSVSFYHEPKFIKYIWYGIQPLLSQEMNERFHFNGNVVNSLDNIDDTDYDWVQTQINEEKEMKQLESSNVNEGVLNYEEVNISMILL